jgi:cell division protein FtsW
MQHEIFSSVLILSVFVVLMYLAGAHPTAILIPFSFSSFVLQVIAGTRHYVQNGIVDYLNPRSDPFCGGFQVLQSLRAIKNGGVFGTHNPISSHQFIYPPNSHTDFIYSIIVENHGWVGGAVLIFICGVYLFRSFKIAAEAKTVKGDLFFSFLGYGLTFFIGLQMIGHIGIVTGLLPTAGVRLPFVSYNGFSLLSTFFSLGLLMNISSNISRLQKKVRKH